MILVTLVDFWLSGSSWEISFADEGGVLLTQDQFLAFWTFSWEISFADGGGGAIQGGG